MSDWVHCEGRSQGRRPYQEDDYGVFELPASLAAGDLLLVLADGMGGERAGDRASATAVRGFIDAYAGLPEQNIPQRLRRALDQANREVALEIAGDRQRLAGMGCTLLAVLLAGRQLFWISVGDSPLWVWHRGRLSRLNQDHAYRTVLAQGVAAGELGDEEARLHPQRNALLSAITGGPLSLVDSCEQPYPIEIGDRVLLASDGLLTLDETEIEARLAEHSAAESPCRRLLVAVAAVDHPDQDNTTVMIASLTAGPIFRFASWPGLLIGWLLAAIGLVLGWWYWGPGR